MCRAATIARCCWNCKVAKCPRNIRCVEKTVPFFCRACGYKTCRGARSHPAAALPRYTLQICDGPNANLQGTMLRIVPHVGPCHIFHHIILRKAAGAHCAPLQVAYHHTPLHITQNPSFPSPSHSRAISPVPSSHKNGAVPHKVRGTAPFLFILFYKLYHHALCFLCLLTNTPSTIASTK